MSRNPAKTLAEFESLCLTGELGIITPDDVVAASALVFKLARQYEDRVSAHMDLWKPKPKERRRRTLQGHNHPARGGVERALPVADRE